MNEVAQVVSVAIAWHFRQILKNQVVAKQISSWVVAATRKSPEVPIPVLVNHKQSKLLFAFLGVDEHFKLA